MRNALYALSEQIKEQQELPANRQPLKAELSNRVLLKELNNMPLKFLYLFLYFINCIHEYF